MGIGRLGTSLYLIDAKGVIVDEYGPAYADIDLPIIDGLAAAPSDGGVLIDMARTRFCQPGDLGAGRRGRKWPSGCRRLTCRICMTRS